MTIVYNRSIVPIVFDQLRAQSTNRKCLLTRTIPKIVDDLHMCIPELWDLSA